MCKAGGPRCPTTPGKQARVRFNNQINRLIKSSKEETDSWKVANASEYDARLKETFAPHQAEDASADDLSWLNYRDMEADDKQDVYDEPEENSWLSENEIDWEDLVSDDPQVVAEFLEKTDMLEKIRDWDEVAVESADPEENYAQEEEKSEFDNYVVERSHYEPSTNRHLLPENAEILSPNPNPVFVYGTLRTGHGNYRNVLEGKVTKSKEGRLPGASMYSNGGFPYVIDEEEGEGVTGELMYLDYDHIVDTMDSLDTLEGTSQLTSDYNLYNRCLRYVHVGDNKYVQAWVYMPPESKHESVKALAQVDNGDWNNHRPYNNMFRGI